MALGMLMGVLILGIGFLAGMAFARAYPEMADDFFNN